MRTLILSFGLGLLAPVVYAVTVNPASNVLGDSENTANTIIYRDSNGTFDGESIRDATIDTAKMQTGSVDTNRVAPGAIDTSKLQGLGSVPHHGQALCVKQGNPGRFGYCSDAVSAAGVCTCN